MEKQNSQLKFKVTDLELHLHKITGHVLTVEKGGAMIFDPSL